MKPEHPVAGTPTLLLHRHVPLPTAQAAPHPAVPLLPCYHLLLQFWLSPAQQEVMVGEHSSPNFFAGESLASQQRSLPSPLRHPTPAHPALPSLPWNLCSHSPHPACSFALSSAGGFSVLPGLTKTCDEHLPELFASGEGLSYDNLDHSVTCGTCRVLVSFVCRSSFLVCPPCLSACSVAYPTVCLSALSPLPPPRNSACVPRDSPAHPVQAVWSRHALVPSLRAMPELWPQLEKGCMVGGLAAGLFQSCS